MVLSLGFRGWFQCRLATDPDPTDEPRGVTGATFAAAGEPDLDGVIRFSGPVCPRSHGPEVGVVVDRVVIDDVARAEHPLLGAPVELLGNARFHERNGIIARSGRAAIDPVTLRIAQNGVVLQRTDLWDPRRPSLQAHEVPAALLERRQPLPTASGMFEMNSPEVADATGIADFPGHFAVRRGRLQEDLEQSVDDVARVALRRRIGALEGADWKILFRLGFRARYAFALNGAPTVSDEHGVLGGTVLTSSFWLPHWPLSFWLGCFDSDALCGYGKGTLEIPFATS